MNQKPQITVKNEMRSAKRKFSAMAVTYFLGVFNDNFFRQTLLLMAVSLGKSNYQSYIMVVFSLPFILCAAYAGWFSDRFPKNIVMITSKVLEFFAISSAGLAIIFKSWIFLFLMLFMMAFQSSLFSPALAGTLPELFPRKYLVKANAIIKIVGNSAILVGIAMAGLAYDRKENLPLIPLRLNTLIFICTSLVVSFSGILASIFVPSFPAANPRAKFPKYGAIETLKLMVKIKNDKLLGIIILSNAFLWFMGSIVLLLVNQLCIKQLGFKAYTTSVIFACIIIGMALGAYLSSRLVNKIKWQNVLMSSGLAMGLILLAIGFVYFIPEKLKFLFLAVMFFSLGIGSGAFTIPLKVFIQILPKPEKRGTIIAGSNFAVFIGVLLSGPFLLIFNKLNFPANRIFYVISGLVFLIAAYLYLKLPEDDEYAE